MVKTSRQIITITDLYKYIVGVVFLSFLVFQLFLSTVLHSRYAAMAQYNKTQRVDVLPNRGIILDRNGVPLVKNVPSYSLVLYNKNAADYIQKHFPEILTNRGINWLEKVKYPLVLYNIDSNKAVQLKNIDVDGLHLRQTWKRHYKYKYSYSHVLGYTSKVFFEDLQKDPTLKYNDIVGRDGIEAVYDKLLRGEHGEYVYEVNALGERLYETPLFEVPKQDGANIYLSINDKWQQALYRALGGIIERYRIKGGAAVILDVNTGFVVAMVSYPAFDSNKMAAGLNQKEYTRLVKNKRLPLFNRVTLAQAPPGSTFKTIVAAAALQEGAITESTVFYSPGVIYLSGGLPFQEYHKNRYGYLTVRDALMVSSNIFFCKTALRLGIEKLAKYAKDFGLGKPTGIDMPAEASGRVPSPSEKIRLARSGAWWLDPVWYPEGDTCNSAIGQGITLVTPLQLARVASIIANKGRVYRPQLAYIIQKPQGQKQKQEPILEYKVPVSEHNLQVVAEGMRLSVAGPRAVIRNLADVPVHVAAKTGTAEYGVKTKEGYLTTHAWVMGFYPYESPQYAFAVFLEGGGLSLRASEVMREFLYEVYQK